jgi:hypothetical protein
MTPPEKRVQTINAPGSETGPGTIAMWGTVVQDDVNVPEMRFDGKRKGRSSNYIPFDWNGPYRILGGSQFERRKRDNYCIFK